MIGHVIPDIILNAYAFSIWNLNEPLVERENRNECLLKIMGFLKDVDETTVWTSTNFDRDSDVNYRHDTIYSVMIIVSSDIRFL